MTIYSEVSQHARRFLALTGYTVEEFTALLPYFQAEFERYVATYTLDGKPRLKRSYSTYSNSPLPTMEDKLLFILVYVKQASTQQVRGGVVRDVAVQGQHLDSPAALPYSIAR